MTTGEYSNKKVHVKFFRSLRKASKLACVTVSTTWERLSCEQLVAWALEDAHPASGIAARIFEEKRDCSVYKSLCLFNWLAVFCKFFGVFLGILGKRSFFS